MNIPIDSVKIPEQYIQLCADWHGPPGCKMGAIWYTGGLTLGSERPPHCETDKKWYLCIWRDLAMDITLALRDCVGSQERAPMSEFKTWVDGIIYKLRMEYRLACWGWFAQAEQRRALLYPPPGSAEEGREYPTQSGYESGPQSGF